jgi:hypothetical protein
MIARRSPRGSLVAPLALVLVAGACGGPPAGADVPGPASLARIDDEPAGEHCTNGGVAVRTGVDDDRDGALDDGEIDATRYVCEAEVWQGDFGPDEWKDPAKVAVLRRVRAVTGDLSLLEPADLPKLEVVGGQLGIGTAPAALPSLWLVAGDLVLAGATAEVRLPALTTVGGDLRQWYGSSVGVLALPALTRVGGDLAIYGGLTRVDLSRLRVVDGSQIVSCPALAELGLGSLTSIGGDLILERVRALSRLDLPMLELVGGRMAIAEREGAVGLEVVAAPRLWHVGSLFIGSAHALTSIELSGLTEVDAVGGDVTLVDLPALRDLDLPLSYLGIQAEHPATLTIQATGLEALDLPLTGVNGAIYLVSNPSLRRVRLAALATVATLEIGDCPVLDTLSAPAADGLDALRLTGDPALVRIELGGITALPTLTLRTTGVADLAWLPSLRALRDADLASNPNLTSLAGTQLAAASHLTIAANPALRSLAGLERLTELDGLDLDGNAVLDNLDALAGLQTIRGDLSIRHHAALQRLGLTALASVTGDVGFEDNPVALQPQIDALLVRLGRTP